MLNMPFAQYRRGTFRRPSLDALIIRRTIGSVLIALLLAVGYWMFLPMIVCAMLERQWL